MKSHQFSVLCATTTMLCSPPSLLVAAAVSSTEVAYGSVNAPVWLLPCCAAATGLLPLLLLRPGGQRSVELLQGAPPHSDTALDVASFSVLDAGHKGQGLFASKGIAADTFLFDYTGEVLDFVEYYARYPDGVSDYTAAMRRPSDGAMFFVDGRHEQLGSPSRWMNHDAAAPTVRRCTFFPPGEHSETGGRGRICMYTTRALRKGEALEWNYGEGYWRAKQNTKTEAAAA